jgi:hypothetical protein
MNKTINLLLICICFSCSKSSDGVSNPNPSSPPDPISEDNSPPSIPQLKFPTNGLLCTDNPLNFNWETSTDQNGDKISYEVEIAQDESFNVMVESISLSQTSTVFSLEKGIELYWRVRAKDVKNEHSPYSTVWQFYTEGEGISNYLPFTPSLINPELNTLVEQNNVLLEWNSSDADNDDLTFDIYFGESNPPPVLILDYDSKSYSIDVGDNKTFYWQVIVKDSQGGESSGQIWAFKS